MKYFTLIVLTALFINGSLSAVRIDNRTASTIILQFTDNAGTLHKRMAANQAGDFAVPAGNYAITIDYPPRLIYPNTHRINERRFVDDHSSITITQDAPNGPLHAAFIAMGG